MVVTDGLKTSDIIVFDNTLLRSDGIKIGDQSRFDNTIYQSDGIIFGDSTNFIFTFLDIYQFSEPEKRITATIVRQDTILMTEYKWINTLRIWVVKGVAATQWAIKEGAPLGYWFARKWLEENWFLGLAMNVWTKLSKKVTNWTKR